MGPHLDNKLIDFKNNLNTNTANFDLNTQCLTVLRPDNVTNTVRNNLHRQKIVNTDITTEDFHTSTNDTINKLNATVQFIEIQLLKTHTTTQTTVSTFEQRTLDRIAESMLEVGIVVNKAE